MGVNSYMLEQLKEKYKHVSSNGDYVDIHLDDGFYYYKSNDNGYYGVVSESGKIIIMENEYNRITPKLNYFVCDKSKYNFKYMPRFDIIKNDGTKLNEETYEYISVISSQFIKCKSKDEWLVLNESGKIIFHDDTYGNLDSTYETHLFINVSNLLFLKDKNNNIGAINNLGNIVLPFVYDDIGILTKYMTQYENNEIFILVEKDGNWGYIDLKGAIRIPFIYNECTLFADNIACVQKNDEYLFINQRNEVLCNLSNLIKEKLKDKVHKIDYVSEFEDGLFKVIIDKDNSSYTRHKEVFVDKNWNLYDPDFIEYNRPDFYTRIKYSVTGDDVQFIKTTYSRKELIRRTYDDDVEYYISSQICIKYKNGKLSKNKI